MGFSQLFYITGYDIYQGLKLKGKYLGRVSYFLSVENAYKGCFKGRIAKIINALFPFCAFYTVFTWHFQEMLIESERVAPAACL